LTWKLMRTRSVWPKGFRLAITGLALSLLFFTLSVISMHILENVLNWPIKPLSAAALGRLAGCILVALGALRFLGNGGPEQQAQRGAVITASQSP
jgi:hypothetical protein